MADSTMLSPPAAPDERPAPTSHNGTPLRSDGLEARKRLLLAALPLFAAQGFAKTSTREIAKAAGVNLAAISYYFGDKLGLYQALFFDPMICGQDGVQALVAPGQSLRQALHQFLVSFTEPLKQGDLVQHVMRLHFREMLEPSGLWPQFIDQAIAPSHSALLQLLVQHLGAAEDDDLHRLAFCIAGLGVQMYVNLDVTQRIRPQVSDSSAAIDAYCERLTDYALAMVEDERRRRGGPRA